MNKFVYSFTEGNKSMKNLLGGKGANLAEMRKIGLPVPHGFTVTTETCNKYYEDGKKIEDNIVAEILEHVVKIEEETGKILGSKENPLLVSVRSGAAISMPGMMDTILNLGLNDETVKVLFEKTNNKSFAYDCYKRFIQMFSDVVLGIEKYKFDSISGSGDEIELIIEKYKKLVKKETKKEFPQDPKEQLMMAIRAVFDSWNNQRAIIYRRINNIPDKIGTAVNVQAMVFGNMGETSGTGVAFTRNPSTGEKVLFGEFLTNAQGEDVVAGIRTPKDISQLKDLMPKLYEEFVGVTKLLEDHYKDMQDIEFTFEDRKLYLLQTRTGKRTAKAAIKIAADLVEENVINKEEALLRIEIDKLDQLLHPTFKEESLNNGTKMAKGIGASPGAASGRVYFSAEDVVREAEKGEKTILVRQETSPEDIEGMIKAQGVLTVHGGMTSHAAVVARGMGKCCVVGCGELTINEKAKTLTANHIEVKEGEYISIDGTSGVVYKGLVETEATKLSDDFETIMNWADEIKRLGIRANADNERDAKVAIELGAKGIGLCRTEHMFFDEERINTVRHMIIAENLEERKEALDKLLPFQRKDFVEIFNVMKQFPVTVRLLDPPLHEFLPHGHEEIKNLAHILGYDYEMLKERVDSLKEFNPMLGHRGCRLAITYPEIYVMQVRAIMEAAIEVSKCSGFTVNPEIMVPLVGDVTELKIIKDLAIKEIEKVFEEEAMNIEYKIGTMIEVPRAALTSDEIAEEADFFSYGTNDLTQTTLAFSRDDSGKFISEYRNKNIFEKDPFEVLDTKGVGKLIEMSSNLARNTKKHIKLGVCGEHGGDPQSIEFINKLDIDYVSCSPYRIPKARLAAAVAVIKEKNR
ncbi:MAG: pyruvate, phosphate dikinase [Anaeromicrobium sp.]|jgi:pyruvate,orthophosphate dikinase|uniref:pyruvate, phosphate dikinase n=1 Tax=Anaeromicrobium sp. TaxID=1929132 RepID=UPI0025F35099|nr:pyruvate, phosphate dikinase [Anaeromicrobium sp.]MCT4594578.1 pyruvate, phosphate dikinase [Anaeromicrobium sp.]